MKIYVASSWRNEFYPAVVELLRACGHDVYDFRHDGFDFAEIDPKWRGWSHEQAANALDHRTALRAFRRDMEALENCELCVLVLPCGRSAHLELGWAEGAGKYTLVYIPEGCPPQEPELMYGMVDNIAIGRDDLLDQLEQIENIDFNVRRAALKAALSLQ